MDASSGEFLYSNIKFAMQHLDQAPPEAQQSLLKALIKDIIVYDDKISINMYVEQVLDDILPKNLDLGPTEQEKGLIPALNRNKALASTPCGSQGRPVWGPCIKKSEPILKGPL